MPFQTFSHQEIRLNFGILHSVPSYSYEKESYKKDLVHAVLSVGIKIFMKRFIERALRSGRVGDGKRSLWKL